VSANIYLGSISADDVAVQLYEGVLDRDGEIERGRAHNMLLEGPGDKGKGWYRYQIEFTSEATGRHGYSVRVIPNHPDARHTLHLGLITWA
jgi:starch phosphorylase